MVSQSEPESSALSITRLVLGPTQTNTYLIGDQGNQAAVVIDPAWDGEVILRHAQDQHWQLTAVWLTHAHFDHFGGLGPVANASKPPLPVALHPADKPMWQARGGAGFFGIPEFDPGPEPTIALKHGMELKLGQHTFEVRHTPGHSPGHVIFVCRDQHTVFCGDLVFMGSVGRTDLPGGSWETMMQSIRQEILTLPDDTRLLSGHGPATTVGQEKRINPFLLELI